MNTNTEPEPTNPPEPRHLSIVRAATASRAELEAVETIEGTVEDAPDAGAALIPLPDRFAVTAGRTANWVVRRVMEARAYGQAVKEWAEAEATRAQREEEVLLAHFGAGLQQVLAEEMERARGRRKSLKLPAGTIGLRAEPARLRVADEDAVIAWAKSHLPQAVRISERPPRGHPAAPRSTSTTPRAARFPTAASWPSPASAFSSANHDRARKYLRRKYLRATPGGQHEL